MNTGCGLEDEDLGFDMLEGSQAPAADGACGSSCTSGCGSAAGKLDVEAEGAETLQRTQKPARASDKKLGGTLCVKCKEMPAQVVGNLREPMCGPCLRAILVGKLKTTINRHSLVVRHDRLLLGFSGGHSSRAALELLTCIQSTATTEAAALAERGRIVFGLDAIFIDVSAVLVKPLNQEVALDILSAAVASYQDVRLHVVKLEDIYEGDEELTLNMEKNGVRRDMEERVVQVEGASSGSRIAKLQELFKSVKDATGREDLLEHLQRQLILRVATTQGYSKIVLADSISRTAGRVLASVVKGQGYAMPGDIQYVDSRWQLPIVWPFRDCFGRDLALFCHLEGLATVFVPSLTTLKGVGGATINSLTDAFVRKLQQDNTSRESTIVRTAHKLTPFPFNDIQTLPIPASSWLVPCEEDCVRKAGEDEHSSSWTGQLTGTESIATAAHSHVKQPVDGGCERLGVDEGLPEALKLVGCCICGAPFSNAERLLFDTMAGKLVRAWDEHTKATDSAVKESGSQDGWCERGEMASGVGHALSAVLIAETSSGNDALDALSTYARARLLAERGRSNVEKYREAEFVAGSMTALLPIACCQCCKHQIFGIQGGMGVDLSWASMLPRVMSDQARKMVCGRRVWVNNHIKDFLLEDDVN